MAEHEGVVQIDYSVLCPYLKSQNITEIPITLATEPGSEGESPCNTGDKKVTAEVLVNQTINVRCWGCGKQVSGFKELTEVVSLQTPTVE